MIKKVLKKSLFIFALLFAWLNYAYFTLDRSSGQPMASISSVVILAIILIFIPIYFYLSFRRKKSSQ
jgi:TRAP-type C4-dicarboxylate transport system permease small subunit